MAKTKALIFSDTDNVAVYRQSQVLASGLRRAGHDARVIDRLSNQLDDLLLVAKHRVVMAPLIVMLREGRVIARIEDVMSTKGTLALIDALR